MTRGSRQKESILKAVRGTNTHPTAEWVYEEVRKTIPNISLGTVYRNLRLLKEEKHIAELHGTDRESRFDGNTQRHYHLYCQRCGCVTDIAPVLGNLDVQAARKTGLRISHHVLEFYGLCPACSGQGDTNRNVNKVGTA